MHRQPSQKTIYRWQDERPRKVWNNLFATEDISESEGRDAVVTRITQSWISINSITDEDVSKKWNDRYQSKYGGFCYHSCVVSVNQHALWINFVILRGHKFHLGLVVIFFGKLSSFSFLCLVHFMDKGSLLSGLSVRFCGKEVCCFGDSFFKR